MQIQPAILLALPAPPTYGPTSDATEMGALGRRNPNWLKMQGHIAQLSHYSAGHATRVQGYVGCAQPNLSNGIRAWGLHLAHARRLTRFRSQGRKGKGTPEATPGRSIVNLFSTHIS